MRKVSLNAGAAAVVLLGGIALGLSSVTAQAAGTGSPPATTGAAVTGQQQVQLTQDQRNKLKQALKEGEQQAKPAAFDATVGQSVPQEITMQALPQEAHQDIPGLTAEHQFARIDDGTILIADQDRMVVSTLREEAATTGSGSN